MDVAFVIGISTLLQFTAAFLALRLIQVTRGRVAWILIATALVLRLLNVPRELHKIYVNCFIPPEHVIKYNLGDIKLEEKGNCLISQELKIPIKKSNTYVFTILFDETPIMKFWQPVHVLPKF